MAAYAICTSPHGCLGYSNTSRQHRHPICQQLDWILKKYSQDTSENISVHPDIFAYCLAKLCIHKDLVLFGMPGTPKTWLADTTHNPQRIMAAGGKATEMTLCTPTQPGVQVSSGWPLSSSLHPRDESAGMPWPVMGSLALQLSVPYTEVL